MQETTIYMGKTADSTHIYADVSVQAGDGRETTFMDHSTGPAPVRVSISFTELKHKQRHGDPSSAPDSWFLAGGQMSPESRVIVADASPYNALIERAWSGEHLNDMHAECDHMTPEMLNPTPEQLAEYAAAHPRVPSYSLAQYWRLDNVRCPETGYKWGSAWLARTPDAETLAALVALIAAREV